MSPTIAKKFASVRSYKLIANVSTAAAFVLGVSLFAFSSQEEKTIQDTDKSSQIWIEKQQLQRGDRWYNGPNIYRAKDRPLFFFLEVSSKQLELDKFVPFFIVIDAPDSMAILSDVAAERYRGEWSTETAGRFRMNDGKVVHVTQWFEATQDNNGQVLAVKTSIRVAYTDDKDKVKEHLFDHKEGCVIVITYDDARKQFNVEQKNVKLPSKDLWQKLTGMDSYDPTNYQLLHDWWISLAKAE